MKPVAPQQTKSNPNRSLRTDKKYLSFRSALLSFFYPTNPG